MCPQFSIPVGDGLNRVDSSNLQKLKKWSKILKFWIISINPQIIPIGWIRSRWEILTLNILFKGSHSKIRHDVAFVDQKLPLDPFG